MNDSTQYPRQHSAATLYRCPLCATALVLQAGGKQYACQHRHHFDVAKEGYLNLLPVQHKSSLEPGDNKPMMVARRAFLEAGHYARLAEVVAALLNVHCNRQQSPRLLDLGCGEGYYSRKLAAGMADGLPLQLHGLDIAKFAVAAAAKKQPGASFVVASANRLPYPDDYFDAVLRVFAPSHAEELLRVLKAGGLLLTVTPGPRHLWQLKAFIYPEVREHNLEAHLAKGFACLAAERLQYRINPSPEHRIALLQMTPFAWHANAAVQQEILAAPRLDIEVDFCVALHQKNALKPNAL